MLKQFDMYKPKLDKNMIVYQRTKIWQKCIELK